MGCGEVSELPILVGEEALVIVDLEEAGVGGPGLLGVL